MELYEAILSKVIKESMIPTLGHLSERNQEVLRSTVKQGLQQLIQLTVKKLEQQHGLEAPGPVPAPKKKPRSSMLPEPRSPPLKRKAHVAGQPVNIHDSFHVSSDYHIGGTHSGNDNQVFKAQQVYFDKRSSTIHKILSGESTDLAFISPISHGTTSDIDTTRPTYNTDLSPLLAGGIVPDISNLNDASEYHVPSLHSAGSTNRDHDIDDESYESDIATEVATDDEREADVDAKEATKHPEERLHIFSQCTKTQCHQGCCK